MPITAITIENFKSIGKPVRVELKPITLLFGPNSAGKSTIVQALHYAREIFERQNLNPDRTILGGTTLDLGGFENLVHNHDKSRSIILTFELDLTEDELPNYFPYHQDSEEILWALQDEDRGWVKIEVKWNSYIKSPLITEYEVGFGKEPAARITCGLDGKQVAISYINFDHPFLENDDFDIPKEQHAELLEALFTDGLELGGQVRIAGNDVTLPLLHQNSVLPNWEKPMFVLEKPISSYGMQNLESYFGQVVALLSTAIAGPGELVRDGLRKLCYVGPLREVPGRNHKPGSSPGQSRWANGLGAYDALFSADEFFLEKINGWLAGQDRLNSGYSVEVKQYRELEINHPLSMAVIQETLLDDETNFKAELEALPIKRRLLIRDEKRGMELEPPDIGVGISQVLPVVVAALHWRTGIVAVEQPELHIHPAFQVALGDLFIEQVRESTDLSFLLETHSEHLLLRLLRRIRETDEGEAPPGRELKPENISIYFIEQGEEGIACHKIRVDEEGDFIDRWPQGFFDERAEELF
jgi:predicted ATPase